MDYSIGSVADIISGSTTPNKPKVNIKQYKGKRKTPPVQEKNMDIKTAKRRTISPPGKVHTNNKQIIKEIDNTNKEETTIQNGSSTKKRKRNQSTSPKTKKSIDIKVEEPSEDQLESDEVKSDVESEDIKAEDIKAEDVESEDVESDGIESEDVESDDDEADDIDSDDAKLDDLSNDGESNDDDDNDEVNDDKPIKKKTEILNEKNSEHTTIFVGNLPITMTHQKLEKMFKKLGHVVNARIRSIPVADPKLPKRIAAIKKKFHPERRSVHGYVTFTSAAEAENALSLNGHKYQEHHIRVNMCNQKSIPDKGRAIFLGNVCFAAEEEELWKLFEPCGEIDSVRLVRDRVTDIGKGFGYVNFRSADSVELALQMGEVKLRDRVLRISLCNGTAPKKQGNPKKKKFFKPNKNNSQQKGKETNGKFVTTAKQGQFQGRLAMEKKKTFNKGNQQKKKMAKKIAPRTISG